MKLTVLQQFTVLDEFEHAYKIVQIAYSDAPAWVEGLITDVSLEDIRLALDRYAVPLLLKKRYSPKECLKRVPEDVRICSLHEGCFGWSKKCLQLVSNKCELYQTSEEDSKELTKLVNFWREDRIIIQVV